MIRDAPTDTVVRSEWNRSRELYSPCLSGEVSLASTSGEKKAKYCGGWIYRRQQRFCNFEVLPTVQHIVENHDRRPQRCHGLQDICKSKQFVIGHSIGAFMIRFHAAPYVQDRLHVGIPTAKCALQNLRDAIIVIRVSAGL